MISMYTNFFALLVHHFVKFIQNNVFSKTELTKQCTNNNKNLNVR